MIETEPKHTCDNCSVKLVEGDVIFCDDCYFGIVKERDTLLKRVANLESEIASMKEG